MSSVQTEYQISVEQEDDLVAFSVGNAKEYFSYTRASEIAQDLRLCARMGMLYDNESHKTQIAMTQNDDIKEETYLINQQGLQQNNKRKNQPENRTRIAYKGNQVQMFIGNTKIDFYWRDALTISGWFGVKAKAAKMWAGDNSKRFRARGILINATPEK